MSWCFPDERTPASRKVFRSLEREVAVVPPHYLLEVANVLLVSEKRGRISRSQLDQFIHLLDSLRLSVDEEAGVFNRVVPLARAHKLTSYDAACLELAIRRQIPLATHDEGLRNAAISVGVTVLGT